MKGRLVFAVDDEKTNLDLVSGILENEDLEVDTFSSAEELLAASADRAPALIVSDVMMPGMSGLELRREYGRRFPHRLTPFLMLSALSTTDDVIRGLESGADDYLTKPVEPRLLLAKVGALLRRQDRLLHPTFRGDLGRFPFIKVLQFCETNGISGEVEFETPSLRVTVPLRAGDLDTDRLENADELLPQLYDADDGTFLIRASVPAFDGLRDVAAPPSEAPTPPDLPMGRLSGVQLEHRLFQVQTECTSPPSSRVVTVVILDGRTVLKRDSSAPSGREDAQKVVDSQHQAVETEVRGKVQQLLGRTEYSRTEDYYELFEAGLEAYRKKEYAKALDTWERARALNPDDRTLAINLRVVKEKLADA